MQVTDPLTGVEVPIFHPRRDRWADHFVWEAVDCRGDRSWAKYRGGAEFERPLPFVGSRRGCEKMGLAPSRKG
jgi:hypothetical protein